MNHANSELRVSCSRCFYFRFHNVPIIPTFGLARRATAAARRQRPAARRHPIAAQIRAESERRPLAASIVHGVVKPLKG
jgi:hypothetical protein